LVLGALAGISAIFLVPANIANRPFDWGYESWLTIMLFMKGGFLSEVAEGDLVSF
jgi:hypothetical protein